MPANAANRDDFSQRLQQQVSAARRMGPTAAADRHAVTPSVPAVKPAGPSPAEDDFSARLAAAAQRGQAQASEAAWAEPLPAGPAQSPDRGPVGQGERVVRQGECLSSIAQGTGHLWDTIWNDAANTELRDLRRDPYVLLPGDRMTIPALRQKSEVGQTEMRHRFRKKGQPERFHVRVLEDDEPRRNEPYTLVVDDRDPIKDVTDAEGQVTRVIPAEAKLAVLTVGEGRNQRTFEFQLGALDPLSEMSGVRGRLRALGFECEPTGPELTDELRSALRDYQRSRKLKVSGQPDEPTRSKLQEDYGC